VTSIESLRLPLRGNDGAISQILSCSGELRSPGMAGLDTPREIVLITEQAFFDIGAGCPASGAIAATEPA
jgi:hypothetical protein